LPRARCVVAIWDFEAHENELALVVLNNGLDLLNVSAYWQTIVKGSIIVVAVIIDERKNR